MNAIPHPTARTRPAAILEVANNPFRFVATRESTTDSDAIISRLALFSLRLPATDSSEWSGGRLRREGGRKEIHGVELKRTVIMRVTLTLDNGCFLKPARDYREIGCYQRADLVSDLRVYVDGEEVEHSRLLKLGSGNSLVELRHTTASGEVVRNRLESSNLDAYLARLDELYAETVGVDRGSFDAVLRIESGHLRPSIVKARAFMETEKQPDGTMKPTGTWKELPSVAHEVVVNFELYSGDNWEMISDGKILLSVKDLGARLSVDIHLAADDETGLRIYRDAFSNERRNYWFPDGCDEGPSGPFPPCQAG